MQELTLFGESRMTVKEVSEILRCDDETVRRHVKDKWPDTFRNGVKSYLSEEQVTYVKLQIERSGRNDLRNIAELPKTELEKQMIIRQAMQIQQEMIAELESKMAIMTPKADFYDVVTQSKDAIDMGELAKLLAIGYGRNTLIKFLKDKKIFMSSGQPYQRYVDAGYFKVVESVYSKPNGQRCINIKTVVFQKGVDYVRSLF